MWTRGGLEGPERSRGAEEVAQEQPQQLGNGPRIGPEPGVHLEHAGCPGGVAPDVDVHRPHQADRLHGPHRQPGDIGHLGSVDAFHTGGVAHLPGRQPGLLQHRDERIEGFPGVGERTAGQGGVDHGRVLGARGESLDDARSGDLTHLAGGMRHPHPPRTSGDAGFDHERETDSFGDARAGGELLTACERRSGDARRGEAPGGEQLVVRDPHRILGGDHHADSVPGTAAKTRHQPELLAHGRYQHLHAVRLDDAAQRIRVGGVLGGRDA